MIQKINIDPNPNYLNDKNREIHIEEIIINKRHDKVHVKYTVSYLNEDNTEIEVSGYEKIINSAIVDNSTRINPATGNKVAGDDTGTIGYHDFLRGVTPEYLKTIYPDANTMGELIDALTDLMIKKTAQSGKFD